MQSFFLFFLMLLTPLIGFSQNIMEKTSESLAPSQSNTVKYQWINAQGCTPEQFSPLTGQNPPGLMAFNVQCSDGTKKVLSANVLLLTEGYRVTKSYKKGEQVSVENLDPIQLEIKSALMKPANKEAIATQVLRKNILQGSVLRENDFEMKKIWKKKDLVAIRMRSGGVEGKAQGVALKDGFEGQPSLVILNNKTLSGIAKIDEKGDVFLEPNNVSK